MLLIHLYFVYLLTKHSPTKVKSLLNNQFRFGNLIGLSSSRNEFSVLLDFCGNAHIDVLVANRNNKSSDKSWINARCQLNGFLGLYEFLYTKKINYNRYMIYSIVITFLC